MYNKRKIPIFPNTMRQWFRLTVGIAGLFVSSMFAFLKIELQPIVNYIAILTFVFYTIDGLLINIEERKGIEKSNINNKYKTTSICHICNNKIDWQLNSYNDGTTEVDIFGGKKAELIAKSSQYTSEGSKITYDILISCPRCKTKNCFNVTK
ncbi:hypothetical protein [Clostridium polynesiense]|uniref:hypothetical protein n=1 Tax=Clostridium polynesiense TaxID=1325933 RepID=UPI00058D1CE4|nr:hypothetical protein [Clostridium polynesiense]